MPVVTPSDPVDWAFKERVRRWFWNWRGRGNYEIDVRDAFSHCKKRLRPYDPQYVKTLERYILNNKSISSHLPYVEGSTHLKEKIKSLVEEKILLKKELQRLTGKLIPPFSEEELLRKKLMKELVEGVARPSSMPTGVPAVRPGLFGRVRGLFRGFLGLGSFLAATFGFEVATWAVGKAEEKISDDVDLSPLLPEQNHVQWISVLFVRSSREGAPHFEPNVVEERITIQSPENGILVFGIALEDAPRQMVTAADINGKGDGNSDWLCESFGDFLICRSLSGADPLQASETSIVSMQFHLPAKEMQDLLQKRAGEHRAYIILPR